MKYEGKRAKKIELKENNSLLSEVARGRLRNSWQRWEYKWLRQKKKKKKKNGVMDKATTACGGHRA